MYGIKAIALKELTRVFKDRKMVMSLFVLPIVLVVGLFMLIGTLVKSQTSDIESHIPNAYIVNEPQTLARFFEDYGISAAAVDGSNASYIEELKNGLLDNTVDVIISFPENFDEETGRSVDEIDYLNIPVVEIFYNPSEDYSTQARETYMSYLDIYKQSLLAARFGDYNAVVMFSATDSYVQDEDKAVGKLLGMMLPYFITMLIFAGAMGLGVDMIAGEKERGTMASMLLSPVNRTQIVLGKVVSLAILAVMSAAVYVISMVIAMPIMIKNMGAGDTFAGLSVNFTASQIFMIVILMIGVVLLYVSIICMVAVFAKNAKEASTYITPVYLLVIVAGFITMYSSADGVFCKYLIPVYGSSAAFKDILTREITMPNFLAATLSTYVFAGILVFVMTKAFNSEKVMFNA